jgi:hypothetical protein
MWSWTWKRSAKKSASRSALAAMSSDLVASHGPAGLGIAYLPAFCATNLATAVIWAGLSTPLKAGMIAPPFVTWR